MAIQLTECSSAQQVVQLLLLVCDFGQHSPELCDSGSLHLTCGFREISVNSRAAVEEDGEAILKGLN